ncbi:MAG: SIMPL domain-containing protein [bacterium]|nr:SIMPL domain-containing protein [bacterium]
MNSTVKNLIGAGAILLALVLSFVTFKAVGIYDRSSEPTNFRSFSVSADGDAVGVPDIAEFSFDVITEGGTDIAGLQQQNTEKMNNAISFVKSLEVDSKDIKTQSYYVSPRYQNTFCRYEPGEICPPAEIVGYSVSQSVSIRIRDFDNISTALTGVVTNGANSVSQLNFTIDDPTGVENEARAEAIQKAKVKAMDIAKAGGFSIGRLLEISEYGSPQPYMVRSMTMESVAMDKDGAVPSPSIEPGSEEVVINVTLRYEIE